MVREKNLNIFVDCHVFDGPPQGTTTYLQGLYAELIRTTHHTYFLAAHDISVLKKVFGDNKNIVYLTYKSKNKFYRLLVDIPRMIKKNGVDYAHFQYVVSPLKFCKYIVTTHDVLFLDFPEYFPWKYRFKNKWLFKMSAKYSDIILSVSEYSKKQIEKHFGVNNVVVTPNGVNESYFETYQKDIIQAEVYRRFGVSNYWLYVSRREPRKNHLSLVKVFAEMGHYKNYSLVFVGSPAIKDTAFDDYFNCLDSEISNRIIDFHNVSADDMLLLARGADLAVYPSFAEGFGIPPLEAIAAQVPTICSNTTAMSDFDFLGACHFDPYDLSQINSAACFALTSDSHLKNVKFVRDRYNWSTTAQQFVRALRKPELNKDRHHRFLSK